MRFDFRGRAITAVVAADGAVNPIVEAPAQSINAKLLIAFEKSAEENLTNIGATVAIGIAEKNNFRRGRHNHAIAPCDKPGRKSQIVGKETALVVNAVAIRIFQN